MKILNVSFNILYLFYNFFIMSEEIKLSENSKKIMEMVEELSILELADLVKAMEEKFGISAAAPVAVAWAWAWDTDWWEEKTTSDVILKSAWWSKIAVIKLIKEITWGWLKEAKELADKWWALKEWLPNEEAEEIKKKFEDAWATVELK